MDFDDLKRVWVDCDKKLAAGIHLNSRQVRSIVAQGGAASANRTEDGEIDYTAPVALAHKQVHPPPIIGFARMAAAWIVTRERGDQLVRRFHATIVRLLGRDATLRG
jgi:hypothetical protein